MPPLMHASIIIKGAREHNLKNIDVTIPRDQLVVITGLSGSGKSSLAFDTIYAEGQRRYVESLSAYARQFLEQMGKPDVDSIEGLSPAISIEQKSTSHNPRSTVGTVTEIYDYLRLLFARVETPPAFSAARIWPDRAANGRCHRAVAGGERSGSSPDRSREYRRVSASNSKTLRRAGYVRARVDGQLVEVGRGQSRSINRRNRRIEIVVDRLVMKPGETLTRRLADWVETSSETCRGLVGVLTENGKVSLYSEARLHPLRRQLS